MSSCLRLSTSGVCLRQSYNWTSARKHPRDQVKSNYAEGSRSHVVLVGRTDSESASRITSNIDPTDRPFILGATESSSRSLLQYLGDQVLTGAPLVEAETAWESKAKLMTLDEAIQAQAPNQYDTWKRKTRGLNTSEAYSVAQQSGLSVFWSADACRNNRGWYRYRGGIDAAISRSITFAKHVDLVWSCAPGYNWDTVCRYEKEVHAAYPNKWLGYNWSFGLFEGKQKLSFYDLTRR